MARGPQKVQQARMNGVLHEVTRDSRHVTSRLHQATGGL